MNEAIVEYLEHVKSNMDFLACEMKKRRITYDEYEDRMDRAIKDIGGIIGLIEVAILDLEDIPPPP